MDHPDRVTGRGLLQSYETAVSLVQRLADAGWIAAAHYAACLVYAQQWTETNTLSAVVAVFLFHLVAEVNGLYRSWRGALVKSEALQVLSTWIVVVPILLFLAFLTKTTSVYSRVVTTAWFIGAPVFLLSWRACVRLVLMELRRKGRNSRNVALAGATPMGIRLAERMLADPYSGMRLVGFYDDRGHERLNEIPSEFGTIVGGLDALVEDARAGKLDRIYITLPLKAEPRINGIIRKLADTTADVYVVADFLVFDLLHAQWSSVGDIPVVSIFDTPIQGVGGWLKRLEDIVIGMAILTLIAIPMTLIAIGVRLSSPGPIFFRQNRYGLNGRPIRVLKFRTMTVMEDGPNVKQATRDDPRITRFGAFLRQTSLDELPQFLQVVTGEMSIVGPRPHAVAHNELYRSKIQGYMLRHKVKPGITGWAQVNGWRGETDTLEKMEKRIEHDLEYIHNWDLVWDIKIILLTMFGSKKNENAY